MAEEDERVDWSALMDAHGIEPDADTRPPAVEPDGQPADRVPPARRRRLVHVIVAVTALFSIAASLAVLIAILGAGDREERAAADPPPLPTGPRPAAFQQTSDGVVVVPPEGERAPEPPAPAAKPLPTPLAPPRPVAKPRRLAEKQEGAAAEKKEAESASPAPPPGPPDPNLPDEADRDGVASAMALLEKDIAACAAPARVSGEVGIKMRIEPDGSVAWASAKLSSSPFQACLDRLFKKARMPRSQKGATVRHTVALP